MADKTKNQGGAPSTGTDLATVNNGAIQASEEAAALAAFLQENHADGLEMVPKTDMVFPKLLILQPMSPLVTQEDQKAGTIANSVTKENYGGAFDFYLIHVYPSRARWMSPDPGSDLDCTSQDYVNGSVKDMNHGMGICAQCPFSAWVGKEPPSCTEFRNLVLIPATDEPSPIIFSTSRSGLKPVAQFTSEIRLSNKPVYFSKWRLETVKNMKDSKVWYTPKFTKVEDIVRAGVDPAQALATLKTLKEMSDMVKESQARIVLDHEQEAPAGGPSDGGEEGSF